MPTCWECEAEGKETTWVPPAGFDPFLREYACPAGHKWFDFRPRSIEVQSTRVKETTKRRRNRQAMR